MPEYIQYGTSHESLQPYIQGYVQLIGPGHILAKTILPRTGTSLVLDFNGTFSNGASRFTSALSGFQERSYRISSSTAMADRLMVRFTPGGLSRFLDLPLDRFANRMVPADAVLGNSINTLFQMLGATQDIRARVALMDEYLLRRFRRPSPSDASILRMAGVMSDRRGSVAPGDLPGFASFGMRQIERRFNALIGTDPRTFNRISRFGNALSILYGATMPRLTDVGYEAGYYDQAHFSNEFKRIAGVRPNEFKRIVSMGPNEFKRIADVRPKKYLPCSRDGMIHAE